MLARLVLLIGLVTLAACADRAAIYRAAPGSALPIQQPVLVVTNRAADPNQPGIPGWERSESLTYGRFTVSIPTDRALGEIPRPRRGQEPDPARHFMLARTETLDAASFATATRAALARTETPRREVVIFVHGFNVTFADGLYRTAQLDHDLRVPGVMMHYSWPSLGAPLGYAHDRDSVLFARDGLVRMIEMVHAAGAERIVLIAHSMGGQLTMEALRQMSLTQSAARRSLAGVVLLSPDLDVDVFRAQARTVDGLPQPFIIVTSRRDRILQLSAGLTGQTARLGNLSDPTQVEGLGVTLVDVSAFSEGAGHFTIGNSASLIALMDQVDLVDAVLSTDESGSVPLIPATILTLQNTTQFVLQPLTDTNQRNPRRRLWLPIN